MGMTTKTATAAALGIAKMCELCRAIPRALARDRP